MPQELEQGPRFTDTLSQVAEVAKKTPGRIRPLEVFFIGEIQLKFVCLSRRNRQNVVGTEFLLMFCVLGASSYTYVEATRLILDFLAQVFSS